MASSHLDRIAGEWRQRAPELARWAMERMVNRTDVWGRYTGRREGEYKAVTAPFREERGKVQLNLSSLEKHFKAKAGRGVLGVHSTSRMLTSLWLAIDVDRHDEDDLAVTPEANFAAVNSWRMRLVAAGFDPLLVDSNGIGGLHLFLFFEEPMDTRAVHEFAQTLIGDFPTWLDSRPELFPGGIEHGHFGRWLRLPGRHHTRSHFSRVWNDEPWADQPWLEGHDAIDRILAARPAPASFLEQHGIGRRRPTVCLDFDGVIHAYTTEWAGETTISDPPTHGAGRAIERLRERYRVVVHSPRCRTEEGRTAIEHWLQKHGIAVDEICEHKPPAMVYLDDRAVRFEGDWNEAISAINSFRR
jgi:hypothetical protein